MKKKNWGHLELIPGISIYSFDSRFLCNKRCFRVIFRVLDEKPTHKHVPITTPNDRNRQFDFVTSDDLDLRKGHHGRWRCLDMSQIRIMSIHRLLMRLFPAFCLGKALNGNVKHFVFDLACDVTADPGVNFFNFIWKIASKPLHCRLNFFATSIGFQDIWGPLPPPPPQQRAGAGLGPAGRGLMNFCCRDSWHILPSVMWWNIPSCTDYAIRPKEVFKLKWMHVSTLSTDQRIPQRSICLPWIKIFPAGRSENETKTSASINYIDIINQRIPPAYVRDCERSSNAYICT